MLEFIQNIDISMLEFIQANIRNVVLDTAMMFITRLGDMGLLWLLTAVVFTSRKKYRAIGITMLISLALMLLLGEFGLKPLIARSRPFTENPDIVLLISEPSGYSFPSSHAMSAFAAATPIFWHLKRLGIGALVVAALIAFSRVYLYVHYPSDILAGSVLGIGCGVAAIVLYSKVERVIAQRKSEVNDM